MTLALRNFWDVWCWAMLGVLLLAQCLAAQTSSVEREFPQSKTEVEKALKVIQSREAGHLPALEGFAQPGSHPLDRYQRAYYQATVEVSSGASGGTRVRVRVKVTAWYNDPKGTNSGYELLISNGRLEADLLDQLSERLGNGSTSKTSDAGAASQSRLDPVGAPSDSAPEAPHSERDFSSSLTQSLAAHDPAVLRRPEFSKANKDDAALRAEVESLEQVLKNQSQPKNLVAVKRSGTPVVASPSLTAKQLFLASIHDEFEMLDFNGDWVHVRISGLSRGWIWRNSVEMPEGIPDTVASPASKQTPVANLFHVTREETSTFPGDWEPLRGKNVKILSVQKVDQNAKEAGAQNRVEYAKYLLEKSYPDLANNSDELSGIVVIFDSADGGMMAATLSTLKEWKAGKLSDAALWHQCFFDPPGIFDSTAPAASE